MAKNDSNASSGASAAPPPEEKLTVQDLTDRPNADARDLQFPSTVGKSGVEVAERGADVDATSSQSWEKVFVLLRREWDVADKDLRHEAHAIACRQYMASQGLRTVAHVSFVGEEDVPGEPDTLRAEDRSVALRYRITAVPAIVAPYEAGTMTFPEYDKDDARNPRVSETLEGRKP